MNQSTSLSFSKDLHFDVSSLIFIVTEKFHCIDLYQSNCFPLTELFTDRLIPKLESEGMIISTNFTEYGIHSAGERYVWITYLLIVLLSSLIGDFIILIATVRYNAIKLNKFLVVVMQHIAVCDILAALSFVLPTMISLIANKWVLGDTLAYIHLYLNLCSESASYFLICVLTCSKFLLLKYPRKISYWTRRNAHKTCVCVWILALLLSGIRFAVDDNGLLFSFTDYNINFGELSDYSTTDKVIMSMITALVVKIPIVLVIAATSGIMIYLLKSRKAARQTGGDQRWQGILTVVATAIVYCVAMVPQSVDNFFINFDKKINPATGRTLGLLFTLNIMMNFYIYSLTIPSFRNFVKVNASKMWGTVTKYIRFYGRYEAQNTLHFQETSPQTHDT